MATGDSTVTLRHHVVVVGADSTTVRLVEELTRAGEQLVVVAPSRSIGAVTAEIQALGGKLLVADHVREPELRMAGIERARAAVILGDDDVQALRVRLRSAAQGRRDDRARLLLHLGQVVGAAEGLRVDLVDVLGA